MGTEGDYTHRGDERFTGFKSRDPLGHTLETNGILDVNYALIKKKILASEAKVLAMSPRSRDLEAFFLADAS